MGGQVGHSGVEEDGAEGPLAGVGCLCEAETAGGHEDLRQEALHDADTVVVAHFIIYNKQS